MRFTHLRVHSEYSLLEGACRIKSLVQRAKELGFHALALTDKNVMYGTIPFYKTCLEAGMKPIIGLEAQVTIGTGVNQQSYPIVLLAKNLVGYRNLLKISTHIQMSSGAGNEAIDIRTLGQYSRELFALSGGVEGEIGQCLLHGEFEQALMVAKIYKNIFQDGHFFLEVEDHGMPEEKKVNDQLLELSAKTGLPLTVTNNVHYLDKDDAYIYEALLAIKRGTSIAPVKKDAYYLKSAWEMASAIPESFQQAMENSANIADACNLKLPLGNPVLPKFPLPEGMTSKEALVKLCEKGLKERYKQITSNLVERLRYELAVIDKMGFNDYFLIVWDFMRFARKNGITTGPGRGSAAGSLVAFVLYITNVDPIKHELLFERFLNPERVSMPDIDIDFPDTRRDEVIAYVADKYGTEHVAQIITFGTLAARAAARDAGRLLELSPKLVDQFAKQIPTLPGMTLEKAYHESPELKKMIDQSDEAKRLYELAKSVEGFPRHASTHAAGVVISRDPLTDIVPLKTGHGNIPLTQFPMEDLEEIGLLKMDFLGLRNLSLLEDIQKNIEQSRGKKIGLHDIPFDDRKTFVLLSNGDTTGIFQLESQGMRNVLKQLKPNEFEDIVAVNALYRPGPMENIPAYIDAKHGRKNVTYPHPDLAPILKKTYGVIVYQEQIMQIASTMAGFSLGEADLLRRAVSKKKREILESERAHFIAGCLNRGYSEETAHSVYNLLVRFADYGFNRSHAVAYSMIAYQLAYLKANYPLEFFAALLSSVIGNDNKLASYFTELKKRQINVLPPSINESDIMFTVDNGGIRFGLLTIKNVGIQALQELIEKRKTSGQYESLFDLCQRVSLKTVNKRVLESLILAGACDEFGVNRASLLATLDDSMEFGGKKQANKGQFAFFQGDPLDEPVYVEVPPFTESEKLAFEKEALGFYFSGHPIERYNDIRRRLSLSMVADVNVKLNKKVKTAVWVEHVRTIQTKKGELMAFLKVSDDTGEIEVIVFPNVYRRTRDLLLKETFLLVDGLVEANDQSVNIIANKITKLDAIQKSDKKLFLKIDKKHHHSKKLAFIKAILARYPGDIQVVLYYEEEKQLRNLSSQFSVSGSEHCLRELASLLGKTNVILK